MAYRTAVVTMAFTAKRLFAVGTSFSGSLGISTNKRASVTAAYVSEAMVGVE